LGSVEFAAPAFDDEQIGAEARWAELRSSPVNHQYNVTGEWTE